MASGDLAFGLRALAHRYEFIRELGRGGMATVHLARERDSGRLVAIKAVDARYAEDGEALARFAREARLVAALEHPNIVRTHAVERLGDETVAIVMEHVPGGTLRAALRRDGAFAFERAERVLREVAEALRYAHARGLVHRDVKPENVFLDAASGHALLSDFGLARAIEEDNRLTLTGTAIGTPTYMSPEQIDGRPLDGRSDIYSLGLVGWEMLAGARPWEGESLYKVIYKQKHEELPRLTLRRPGIPEHLLFTIEGALHKDRETRWADVDELLEELDERPEAEMHPGAAAAAPTPEDDAVASRVTPSGSAPPDPVADVAGPPPAEDRWPAGDGDVALPAGWERPASRLAVPLALALALLAAITVGGGRWAHHRAVAMSRDAATHAAMGDTVTRDTVTRTASAGELETALPPVGPPDGAGAAAGARPPVAGRPRAAQRAPARPRGGGPTRPAVTGYAPTHGDSLALCRSPAPRDQRACLTASVADDDRGLNNVYRTLIGEMRKQARVPVGGGDPPAVGRLRARQRAWHDRRDDECRRRGAGGEGALWAPARARCLGELGTRRAAVLADALTRLRAP